MTSDGEVPPAPDSDGDGLVTVDAFVSVTSASLARARLEAEGIDCHLGNEHMAVMRDGLGPATLQVRAADAGRARAILGEALDEPPVDPEDGPVCPHCAGQYAEKQRTFGSWLANLVTLGRVVVRTHWVCRKCGHSWEPDAAPGAPYRSS